MQGRGVGRLDEEEVKAVTKQVLSGLGYLHNQGIIHVRSIFKFGCIQLSCTERYQSRQHPSGRGRSNPAC